ncbi:hypothetical protein COCVIDRAFT_32339 [Bipolaris victoriae FI3]|uniref:Uncharacterized protein n=1 Tax=Bipolaris victoriae (strain FI3) TaxID=930091 RepID=W7DWL2_BIPV3|nr:hypothetical protein COCVIDRAFT_32339 [Bipolaris victoriae FI3]
MNRPELLCFPETPEELATSTQLATAAIPAVLTTPAVTLFSPTSAAIAKATADDLAGPPAPTTPLSSRTLSLSERISNLKEFDRT